MRVGFSCLAAFSGLALPAMAHASRYTASDVSMATNTSAIFLISESDLGDGFKVCHLSDGTQQRIEANKACPYPLRGKPFVQQAPSNDGERELPVKASTETAKLSVGPAVSRPTAQQPDSAAPEEQSNIAANVADQTKTVGKPLSSPKALSLGEPAEDTVAIKAMRRCEMIGFQKGTDQFRSCALEQIRIISNYKL